MKNSNDTSLGWRTLEPIDGITLVDSFNNGELSGLCPAEPGIYFWLRRLSPTSQELATKERFLDWLNSALLKKQGVVNDRIKHIGRVELSIGGSELDTKVKKDSLSQLAETRKDRLALQKLFSYFDYTMILYVGESENIQQRILQHLSNRTDFSVRLKEMDYEWEELGLIYCVLPELAMPERRALERILSILLLAPATSRAG